MHILVSNDDGYQAPGLICLVQALAKVAEITVVAPDRNRSGASNSLTLDNPLRITQAENGFYHVNGTPTDCVHLAITGLLDKEPDMVIAGINAGANMGDDVVYSGTVAAAMEGRFMGLPAIAISLAGTAWQHYVTAAKVAVSLVQKLQIDSVPPNIILNVNVPDVPWEELGAFDATRLGNRHKAEPAVKQIDPRGRDVYWVGPAGPEQDAGPGTDFYAIKNKRVSVTPIQVDLTRYAALNQVAKWLEGIKSV